MRLAGLWVAGWACRWGESRFLGEGGLRNDNVAAGAAAPRGGMRVTVGIRTAWVSSGARLAGCVANLMAFCIRKTILRPEPRVAVRRKMLRVNAINLNATNLGATGLGATNLN